MRQPARGACRPARAPSSDRSPSRSDRRHPDARRRRELLDYLLAGIRPPVIRTGIYRPPFIRGFTGKQFLQRISGAGPADNDLFGAGFDFHTFAPVQPELTGDFIRKADGEIFPPAAYDG